MPFRALAAASLAAAAASAASAETLTVTRDLPLFDQWVYPFNANIAGSFFASVFSSQLPEGFTTQFDNRDGQALVVFDLAGVLPLDVDPAAVSIVSATLTMRTNTDLTFQYDPTPDSYVTWLQPDDPDYLPDGDPGRALEVFGAGFRNGVTAANFVETTPYSPVGPFGQHVRNVFPIAFDSPRADLDVSSNVTEAFDPTAFGVGSIDGLSPGDFVPVNTDVVFELDVDDADVADYIRTGLAGERLFLVVASLFKTEQQGAGTFPSFYTKENPAVAGGFAEAGRLALTIELPGTGPIGDLDGNGVVDGADLGLLLSQWGGSGPADLDGSGVVDGGDLGLLLANWG